MKNSYSVSALICEGMCFVSGAVLKNSGSNCSADGNMVTIRTCWLLTSRWITGDARELRLEFNLRFSE